MEKKIEKLSETEVLLSSIEAEVAPWQKPWTYLDFSTTQPRSWKNRLYGGSNVIITMFYAYLADYAASISKTMADIELSSENIIKVFNHGFNSDHSIDMRFATFNAIKNDLEGTLNKGSKAATVKFFRPKTKKELNEKGEEEEKVVGFIKTHYSIFPLSVASINQDKLPKIKEYPDKDIYELCSLRAKEFIKLLRDNSELKFSLEGNQAFWRVGTDVIHTPKITQFTSEGSFWGTLFHEITHWTGDESRLNRNFSYAQEELVAELGSWELCRILKVDYEPAEKKAYLKSWLSSFSSREDKLKALEEALKAVDKAVKYLLKLGNFNLNADSGETEQTED
ncbi:zincin-like metallopeptidase domain-containing protein [Ruminobacter sp.]|uniref:zincin-like metallopeptidase domain-containing protein n=1 Tax=Ruminobacter sp. TaxID=2774296 RepID=UPI00386C7A34